MINAFQLKSLSFTRARVRVRVRLGLGLGLRVVNHKVIKQGLHTEPAIATIFTTE